MKKNIKAKEKMENDILQYKKVFEGNEKELIGAVVRDMEHATREQMALIGADTIKMLEDGYIWVICFTKIEINKLPVVGKTYISKTWPSESKYGMRSRRFKLEDEQGNLLVQTASMFTVIDPKTRKQAKEPEYIKNLPVVQFEDDMKLPKIAVPFPEKLENKASYEITENEIDVNGHVNNAYYIDWALGFVDDKYLEEHDVKTIWLNYQKEIKLGDIVDFEYLMSDDVLYVIGKNDENTYFLEVIEFTK